MKKKKNVELPETGSAFAFPLDDGRYSACRVLEYNDEDKDPSIKVACSCWIGEDIPELSEITLREILYKNHHSWNNDPAILWISDALPTNFISLGEITPTLEDRNIECSSYGNWPSLTLQPLAQWLWDNDRETSDANDKIKKENYDQQRKKSQFEREEYLKNITLETLLKREFFEKWDKYPSEEAKQDSQKIMKETIERLIYATADAEESIKIAHLENCILCFNTIDTKYDGFIETIEREDICEEFESIVYACNLGHMQDLADEWRDW